MLNDYNDYSTTTNLNGSYEYCQYRLPCGLCEKLKIDCPKYNKYNLCRATACAANTGDNIKLTS